MNKWCNLLLPFDKEGKVLVVTVNITGGGG